MTKKELKDIILKTLEKEGGAAGLKALAKASKTSKNKLKKDLDDMSGVKQHQDGDYISTPINEVDYEYEASSYNLWAFCNNCPCGCGDVIENCVSAGGQGYACANCKENCGDTGTSTGGASNIAGFSGKTDDDRFINRPRKPMRGKPIPRKPIPRKPMRLREVKEIIETMLDEKKKKKKDRCHRKADQVYGTKTSAYKSGAIVKCRKGMIWKVGGKKKK